MFCAKCGSYNPDDNSFCAICGSPISNASAPLVQQDFMKSVQNTPVYLTMPQPQMVSTKNGMAKAGLVFGILAAVMSIASFSITDSSSSDTASIIMAIYSFAILGTIFSAIGIARSRKLNNIGKGMSITGLILSICSFMVPVLVLGISTYTEKAKNASLSVDANRSAYVEILEEQLS